MVEEGQYVEGEKRGQWIIRHPDGTVTKETYVNGTIIVR